MRLLHPDPAAHGHYLIGVRPGSLGATIRAVGTPGFVAAVTAFVNDSIAADAVHLERWRADTGSTSGYVVEWLGSGSLRFAADTLRVMDVYYQDYCHVDPLFAPLRGKAGTLLVQRHIDGLAHGDFRRRIFDEPGIAQECVLVHGNAHVQYALGLARTDGQAAFTTDELFHFRQMVDLLFPMFDLHARTCAARRVASVSTNATSYAGFDARLERQNVQLSRREHEICRLLLCGRSVPEAAQQLDVKLSTAESYVKRAFAKLGVRTRRELFDWVLVDC
ncbi:helix-turn-helix transcriptional regulator [Burkholderia pseudomultivorans]|uniref:Helix-turn-helix transcriptional regulator n=2 Tax=Burkholderia pseudomultivorans TaxID=1207504 RepID=A0A132EU52_9BURK|nr:helix-turn-helix transcriptional regulator [Burkholderia pseudomultivorans]AOI89363.1 helix-turn-helix transcriptional regulator [Burkholderia pseudomultivorans]KVC34642.1 helix-turn-helix transcriptional regulator [Burkholderia pseudomultivorans]KVC35208.1 helix-turn-helix transcriptional regulator [Burkholderia pseudomultivorans]KVC40639.1 helix-turn-helix transcriptional regulator [Burkholderia pseudomultivorans]KVG64529.1 helix-turn-helix transcriptional regulator [Burkholderia pseudomu